MVTAAMMSELQSSEHRNMTSMTVGYYIGPSAPIALILHSMPNDQTAKYVIELYRANVNIVPKMPNLTMLFMFLKKRLRFIL